MITIERFNISKGEIKAIQDGTQWGRFVRKFELDKIFCGIPEDYFKRALELGCGSGEHSKHLAFYCKELIALEYNEGRLVADNDEKTTFVIGDAQDLSRFSDSEMDLIFSSNLIEHLPKLDQCLAECRRVVEKDGMIVHTVPNRTWKIFNLLLFYPFIIKTILCRVFLANKSARSSGAESTKPRLDDNLRVLSRSFSLRGRLVPAIHGISKSHFSEFMNWGEKRWISIFEKNGFEVVKIIRLPFYFGWSYNFRFILRLGNYLRFSSSTAFFLKKTGK